MPALRNWNHRYASARECLTVAPECVRLTIAVLAVQMASQGDDDSPHDAAAQRGGAFTIAAHDGNGWPTSSALRSASSPEAAADVGAGANRGGGSLLRPVMRMLPSAALAGGRGHYADRSTAQPDQPEELLQVPLARR